jgi:hypothetical protein
MKKVLSILWVVAGLLQGQTSKPVPTYRVKHVAEGAVYLEGGRSAGLSEGLRLTIRRPAAGAEPERVVAELEVTSVASASAVCEIKSSQGEIEVGDTAYLSLEDTELLQAVKSSEAGKKYVQVVTFTEGDPLDEEARAAVPHAPSPAVNRVRGRIGFEYNSIQQPGGGGNSSQLGLVVRTDMTRIGGSYWSVSGFWRGRLSSRNGGTQQTTITDLLNRTYHLSLTYNNPQSPWMMGFGRLFLPWANSLETIDGGYLAHRIGRRFTAGTFAGSTPDPTSWNYAPNRQLAGSFLNYTAGSFETVRVSSTAGVAASYIQWKPERQFAFFENGLFFGRHVSVYHNLETDRFRGQQDAADNGMHLSRSFLTVRLQPLRYLSFDISHNYFRNVPTFDPRLVATGLLDKLLFQGASAGFRLELPWRTSAYASFGRSSRSGDSRSSLNQMYGLAKSNILRTGIRVDARYSKFDSSFGRGTYRALSASRSFGERIRFDLQAGQQNFTSALTNQNRARFINSSVDWFLAAHYALGAGYTLYRSPNQNYNQMYVNLGYRF